MREHICKTPITAFPLKYKAFIDAILAAGGKPVLLTLPPIDARRYFERISSKLNADNILKFLGGVQTIFSWQEKYSAIVSSLAESCNALLIDIREGFLSQRDYRDYLCDDGIHPNKAGHFLISEILQNGKWGMNGGV